MNLKSVYNEFMKLFFGKIEIGMWSIFPPKHQNRMFEIFSFCVFSLLKMKINIEVIIAYQAVSYQLPVPKYMYSYSDCPPTYLPIHPYSSNIIKKSFQFYPAVSTIMISWIFSIIKWMLHLFQFSKNWRRKMTFSDKIHLLFTKYGKCKLYI